LEQLTIVSFLAPNWFGHYEAVAAYLGELFQLETDLLQGEDNPLTDTRLINDELDLAFICGLPFSRYCYQAPAQLEALVAPVMQFPRYQDQPVYFSDVIVPANHTASSLADLQEARFCYNDRGSNSGYQMICDRLFQAGYGSNFFKSATPSGSHQHSIRWVAEGLADCAAIDSTVLEREQAQNPDLIKHIRILESIGPCPMPPLVVAQHLGQSVIHALRSALLQPNQTLQDTLQQFNVKRFAAVQSKDYDSLRRKHDQLLSTWA